MNKNEERFKKKKLFEDHTCTLQQYILSLDQVSRKSVVKGEEYESLMKRKEEEEEEKKPFLQLDLHKKDVEEELCVNLCSYLMSAKKKKENSKERKKNNKNNNTTFIIDSRCHYPN